MGSSDSGGPRLAGKIAIVTGASRGIGLAVARRLAEEGACVCITARKADALGECLAEFPEGCAIAIAGKSDDSEHRSLVLDTVANRYGGLDILVNNAGINPVYGPLLDLDLAAARKILDVNLIGSLAWVQDAVHHPRLGFASRRGGVINVSSVTGEVPSRGIGWYGISKAAISHLTRTLGAELGPEIRVNAVAPAVVKTRFSRALYEGIEDEITMKYPLGRLGLPEDVAASVAFLASDDAAWITSQVINLDGGLLAAGGSA